MSDIVIRAYEERDAQGVNAVARAAFGQYQGRVEDWDSFIDGIGRMAELARGADLVVAERGGAVLGAVAHIPPGHPRADFFPAHWSLIRMLVVDPRQHGQGIGRRLTLACLAHARRIGAPAIGLHTSAMMAPALRMYLSLGFARDMDLAPIRGVAYGRYVLPAAGIDAALGSYNSLASRPFLPTDHKHDAQPDQR